MRQVTPNLHMDLGGITDDPSLIPNMVTNMLLLDAAAGDSTDAVARAAAATADAKAVAAQADATQALSAAAAAGTAATEAGTTAAGAATTAAAAEALAQQAIAAGLNVKQLSYQEITSIIALPTGTTGIGSFAHIYDTYASYVINVTPRIKLVALGAEIRINSNMPTGSYKLRTGTTNPKILSATYSFVPYTTIDLSLKASPASTGVEFWANITTPESPANLPFFVSIVGALIYGSDVDLGTDIS